MSKLFDYFPTKDSDPIKQKEYIKWEIFMRCALNKGKVMLVEGKDDVEIYKKIILKTSDIKSILRTNGKSYVKLACELEDNDFFKKIKEWKPGLIDRIAFGIVDSDYEDPGEETHILYTKRYSLENYIMDIECVKEIIKKKTDKNRWIKTNDIIDFLYNDEQSPVLKVGLLHKYFTEMNVEKTKYWYKIQEVTSYNDPGKIILKDNKTLTYHIENTEPLIEKISWTKIKGKILQSWIMNLTKAEGIHIDVKELKEKTSCPKHPIFKELENFLKKNHLLKK